MKSEVKGTATSKRLGNTALKAHEDSSSCPRTTDALDHTGAKTLKLAQYFLGFTWENEGCRKSMLTVQKLATQRSFRLIISETARVTEGSTGCTGVSIFSKPFAPNTLPSIKI